MGGDVSWRSHLLYATLLSLQTLDQTQIVPEVTNAKKKVGNGDTNYVYLAMVGNIFMLSQQYKQSVEHLEKSLQYY